MQAQNKPTIIVTGGAGYIGSHTIIELLNKTDLHVISIDNFSNSSQKSYQRIKDLTGKNFEHLNFDLCDAVALNTNLSKLENVIGIIHFAAFKSVPQSVSDPLMYYHNNLLSLNNLLRFATEKNINHFIFSSSCSVYGNAEDLPVTEHTPFKKAESPYAHTKQIGEEIIENVCKSNSKLKTVILRYFNPVGAHNSGLIGELPLNKPNNLVPVITQTAVGKNSLTVFGNDYNTPDGSCVRDYIHVSDIAEAHVKALNYLIEKRNTEQLTVFNLGTGKGISVLEAIQSFEKVSKIKLKYTIGPRREGDVVSIYANNNKSKKELGWIPQYNIDDMMLSAWKWQQHLESEK